MTIYIEQLTDNYEYIFRLIQSLPTRQTKPTLSLELPGTTAENSLQMQFEGQKKEHTIAWLIFFDNVDRANGTYSSTVKTIDEQIAYLTDEIAKPDLGVQYKMFGDNFAGAGTPVAFEDLSINKDALKPMYATATARIKVGTVV